MNALALIPARRGSKGIPQKNTRDFAGMPLIAHVISSVQKSGVFERVVVATDCSVIRAISESMNARVYMRSHTSSTDSATIDDVVVEFLQTLEGHSYDFMATFQPTSPLLKHDTIQRAAEEFLVSKSQTLLSVVESKHLEWSELNGTLVPQYTERLNRQMLPLKYRETGGFVFFDPGYVIEAGSRISPDTRAYILNQGEAIDIDTEEDWLAAESIFFRKKIIFRILGDLVRGIGHVYNSLQLVNGLCGHDVIITTAEHSDLATSRIKDLNYPCQQLSDTEFLALLECENPDLLVLDCLDNDLEFIDNIKKRSGCKIASFEDRGSGASEVDIVVNAIYRKSLNSSNELNGYEYFLLREEFLLTEIEWDPLKKVQQILLVFGGVDPSNLTRRCYELLRSNFTPEELAIKVILGMGYAHETEFLFQSNDESLEVIVNCQNMATEIISADLVISSAGRTVYEVMSQVRPVITICQNGREAEHYFGDNESVIGLGLHSELKDDDFLNTVKKVIRDAQFRSSCVDTDVAKRLRSNRKSLLLTLKELL